MGTGLAVAGGARLPRSPQTGDGCQRKGKPERAVPRSRAARQEVAAAPQGLLAYPASAGGVVQTSGLMSDGRDKAQVLRLRLSWNSLYRPLLDRCVPGLWGGASDIRQIAEVHPEPEATPILRQERRRNPGVPTVQGLRHEGRRGAPVKATVGRARSPARPPAGEADVAPRSGGLSPETPRDPRGSGCTAPGPVRCRARLR